MPAEALANVVAFTPQAESTFAVEYAQLDALRAAWERELRHGKALAPYLSR